MTIPDAAIEAAAEAMWTWDGYDNEPGESGRAEQYRAAAREAVEAALPAIREALAQEIEAWIKSPLTEQERWENAGGRAAARIVRGGAA